VAGNHCRLKRHARFDVGDDDVNGCRLLNKSEARREQSVATQFFFGLTGHEDQLNFGPLGQKQTSKIDSAHLRKHGIN
jgi:hypothetical protein